MFAKKKTFTKKVVALVSGKTTKRVGNYSIPQFGGNPPDGKDIDTKYTEEEAGIAIQEAVDYFGTDGIVRFLNWACIVKAQRISNNDLRTAAGGLDKASQARYTLLMNMAKRQAEAEVGDYDEKGELVIDRKSKEYLEALKESLNANLKKPKFADLESAFKGAEGDSAKDFDLMTPGALNATPEEDDSDSKDEETVTA